METRQPGIQHISPWPAPLENLASSLWETDTKAVGHALLLSWHFFCRRISIN